MDPEISKLIKDNKILLIFGGNLHKTKIQVEILQTISKLITNNQISKFLLLHHLHNKIHNLRLKILKIKNQHLINFWTWKQMIRFLYFKLTN